MPLSWISSKTCRKWKRYEQHFNVFVRQPNKAFKKFGVRQSDIFSPPFSRLSCFRITNLVILQQEKREKGSENISDWRKHIANNRRLGQPYSQMHTNKNKEISPSRTTEITFQWARTQLSSLKTNSLKTTWLSLCHYHFNTCWTLKAIIRNFWLSGTKYFKTLLGEWQNYKNLYFLHLTC